ncbi:hypothetical protein QQF64_013366 [Cirrhinus molitorella]|uniref:C2H2-type domain-containing protein n=1 Tax=Cirrhinus molitorella TaxID=172907 RepID=A0ABR3LR01_9TELE
MDGELPPWNTHGSHNSRVSYNTAVEHQEEHDEIGNSFADGEPMTSLSSCMSGAFQALLPDYNETSSAMSTDSDKYSCSPDNRYFIKPDTAVDEKIAVERMEKSDFSKDPLGEASASETHMLPPRCAQYGTHEKNQKLDQGSGNWTSVIKNALEMSNGMEMEQTLSMNECGSRMDYNPIYKGPETEANFKLKDNYQIAGFKLNEKQDGQGVKEEPDSFISVLSDGISKKKDVLEMEKNEDPSILDVGTFSGIREHKPGLLPGRNRSSYTPFSSSESFMKSEQFPGIPLEQSVDRTLQGTTQGCRLSCKDVSPRKTAGTNTGFKHANLINETVPESSTVDGLHHLDLQKDLHQAEITDGKTSQDHSSQHNVQDERVKTSNLHVFQTTVIKQSAACLPNSQYFGSKLKEQVQDLVPTQALVGSQDTTVDECENVKLRIPKQERISENSLHNEANDFQETSINTKTELSLKLETKLAPEILNSSSVSEIVPVLPVVSDRIHTDYKCKDSQFESVESGKLKELCFQENHSKNVTPTLTSTSARSTDDRDIHVQEKQTPASLITCLLPFNENLKNSERSEKAFLSITSESSFPPSAPPSPTSRSDCSSQHNLQKALQMHKKVRKRKKSELEALKESIHLSHKRDNRLEYASEKLDSAVKLDTTRHEEANQNVSLPDYDSTAPKQEDLITNVDINPPTPRKKCQTAQPELVADTSEKPDHSCSEASQEEVPSNPRINRKAVSRRKLKKNTKLRLKAKNSATLSNQCLSQSTVLSPEEDCTSHFQISDTTLKKEVSNPAVIQHAMSSLDSSSENVHKSGKKTTKQTLQCKDDPQKDVPTTFSELEADVVDVKGHQKERSFLKGKNKNTTSLLNTQSSLDSEGQTDPVSTSVAESSNILSPQNNPKKSKQKKRAHIIKAAKTPNVCAHEDMENMMISKTKPVKAKRSLKKATRTDDNGTTLLDTQPSTDTVKQADPVSNVGNEAESPVILSTPRKSAKKKLSDTKCKAVEQTTAQQSILNPLSESDDSIVQPTIERLRTRKTLDKKGSHNTVSENCEPAHLAPETDYSGVSQQNTEMTPTATEMDNSDVIKQKKTNVQMKSLPKKATKRKTHNTQAISDIREQSTVQQENSASNSKTNSRSEDMTKKCMKKRTSALKVRNNQPEDHVEHSTALSPPVSQSKDATQDPCIKTDPGNETAVGGFENQVSITTEDVASPQRSMKAAKKTHSNIQELAHREDKMSDVPSVVRGIASEKFETDSCDQHLKIAKKKSKKSVENVETHLSEDKNNGSNEAGVMVTFTQVEDFCKFPDGQTVGSQQPEKDGTVVDQKDLNATKNLKKKGRKAGRKKRKMACMPIQTVKEEECEENRIACGFQNNTQIQISDNSESITDNPDETVMKLRKSTRTQKTNSDPVVENLSQECKSTVSLDITGETCSSSMQAVKCEDQYTVEKMPPRRGRPPSKKNKKLKLLLADLEDNTSPSVQISGLSPCQDNTENTVEAAASTEKLKIMDKNVIVTEQLGTDPPESLPSATDPLSHSIPTSFNEEGKTSLALPGTEQKQELCEEIAKEDLKIESKGTIKVLKGRKRGRKRRKPAKSLLTKYNITSECSTADQNDIVKPEKIVNEKTMLGSVEMISPITAGTYKVTPKTDVLCSTPSDLSSHLMKEVNKYKVEDHIAEPSGKDSFEVSVQPYNDNTGVSRGTCNLISSNVVKEESEQISLDTKIKPNITQKADVLSVETSGKKVLDNSPEPENVLKPSTERKVDGFTQDSEDCAVMPNKVTNNRMGRSKSKEMVKKPLTCKYCGVSFRHITAYTIHRRIHTGDKPYKCKTCGKTFAQLSKLKSHHNIHKQDTSFPCPFCSQKFLQKDDLLCHFKVHMQESKANSEPQKRIKSKRTTSSNVSPETSNNYGCLICKKNFVSHVKLQNHMQAHEVDKSLTCKDCRKTFWKQSDLIAHEKTHWPVKPYACSICGKGFNQLTALKKHSQNHAGETPFSCFHCGHGFSALSALRMHQASKTCIARRNDEASSNIEGFIVSQGVDGQVNTPVFFKCQICKLLFRKWCQYTLHLQTHTNSPPYICFSCGQCYEKDSEMNVHCDVCCQSSGEEKICGASLIELMQGVTQTYPLKCTTSQSSQTPTSSEQLMDVAPIQTRETDIPKLSKTYSAHSPIKLPNAQSPARSDVNGTSPSSPLECIEITQSLWKFKCSRCGQRFERYRALSAHLQTHAPGFRYTCTHCGQFFERWSKLWLHQQRHRLKRRCYSCTQCNLQFRFFSSFREHMIDHAGQRPYACPLCPKTFIQEASLHAHQCESHKLCKRLKCDVCSKTFSSLRNLIKHSLLHNGSTSHICLLCNLSFTNTRVLKEHLKTHTTYHGPALPDIPSKPLDFPHKCKRCKASFSSGDLLYAHQIRHSRDAKTHIRPAVVPTSKLSDSCHNDTPSSTSRNHISNLNLDGIPNDDRLYVYSHPDKLYVSPSRRVQLPVINLDPDEPEEVLGSQNPGPKLPNGEITSQSNSTHLPQATSDQENTNPNSSASIKIMANDQRNYSRCEYQRSPTFVETSVDMEVETHAQEEESFECADCTEKLTSVLGLYEHYILHAMGDAYVQVH